MAKRAIIPLIILVVAALLFFVINGRLTLWLGGRAEQKTDDAYVQADMTPLSTRISGTVRLPGRSLVRVRSIIRRFPEHSRIFHFPMASRKQSQAIFRAHERVLICVCYFHENFTSELLAPVLMWQRGGFQLFGTADEAEVLPPQTAC